MRKPTTYIKLLFGLILLAVVTTGSPTTEAKGKPGGGCPKPIFCADVWIPVQCADGIIYSNACYADRACAPGPCVPVDGGPSPI